MGKRLHADQIITLRQVFQDSGAIEYGKKMLHSYLTMAQNVIKKLQTPTGEYHNYLQQIITLMSL